MSGEWDDFLIEIGVLDAPPMVKARPVAGPVRAVPKPPSIDAVLAGFRETERAMRKALVSDAGDQIADAYRRLREMAAAGRITAVQAAKGEAEIHRLAALAASARAVVA